MSSRWPPTIYPPSTGELMDRANLLARRLLYDAHERDGRAMLRTWGEAVEGAADLWSRLPRRSDLPGTGHDVITQLERSARTLHRTAGNARQVDPTLAEIGRTFTRAATLIEASGMQTGTPPTRWTPRQIQDAFAARVNIMHTLYVSSHAISVALAATARAENQDQRLQVHNVTAEELRHRVLDVEQVAHSYINGHHPGALAGRHREPVDDNRIDVAVATWDVHAHRTLTREPTADAMAQVAGAAFSATMHAHRLWRAATDAGQVDPHVLTRDIAPALETMIERWGQSNTLWHNLHHPQVPPAGELREASWELVNAMREVTQDRVGPATHRTIAQRVDMPSLVRSLHRFHATVAGVGDLFYQTARRAPFVLNARPLNDLARELATSMVKPGAHLRGRSETDGADAPLLSPRDVLLRRAVPLPGAVRPLLEEPARQASTASRGALRATLAASDQKEDTMHVPDSWTKDHRPVTTRLTRSQQNERRHLAPVAGPGGVGGPGR
ncbi:hypothetical protein [Ornithinimicrobium sp. LYQ103]|uniref:hypothetical protein n=1 Tax=Ornithinimicrobium sp. LYQ103 TaxID=3378796 RepID=UPI0038519951